MLFAVQLRNVKYVVDKLPWVAFSHVLCIASNEVFLRRGVADFVQKYDVSKFARNSGSIRDFHAYPGAEARPALNPLRAKGKGEVGSRAWPGRIPPFGIRGSLQATMPGLETNTAMPHEQFFTEGSYFRKDIALALSNELQLLFPLQAALTWVKAPAVRELVFDSTTFSNDRLRFCFPHWFSWSEIVPGMLLLSLAPSMERRLMARKHLQYIGSRSWKALGDQSRELKFGPRISSVVWNRPNWAVTPRDVQWIRCSPFSHSLFALKRHVFDESNPFFRKIRDLQRVDEAMDGDVVRRLSDECYRSVPLSIGF
jgi:hypothetical protein